VKIFIAFSLLVLKNELTRHVKFGIEMEYARSGHNMVFAYYWCGLPKLPGENNGQVVYMYVQLNMNSILKDFVKKVDK